MLAAAVDVHVDGPAVSPELPARASRWPHRVADLGPFTLVDASASVSADRTSVAVTLANRSPDAADEASLVLRDFAFAGPASVTTLTDSDPSGTGHQSPPAAEAHALAITLPPRSFTVVEAPIAARRRL